MDSLDELLFNASPYQKFYEVLQNGGSGAVEKTMEGFITRYIAMQELLERSGVSEEKIELFEGENGFLIEKSKNDVYIELTAKILGQEG